MVIFKTQRFPYQRIDRTTNTVAEMGKVRTEMIKRISNTLVDKYERSLTTEFEPNKQFLKEIGLDVSKKLRNKIAGYVTGLMKIEATAEI